jgi:hypothetical protein
MGPFHCGGRSSLASQPTASVFMGSTGIETCSVRSQVEHSNVRTSQPRTPAEMRASAIRCLHVGRHFDGLREKGQRVIVVDRGHCGS